MVGNRAYLIRPEVCRDVLATFDPKNPPPSKLQDSDVDRFSIVRQPVAQLAQSSSVFLTSQSEHPACLLPAMTPSHLQDSIEACFRRRA